MGSEESLNYYQEHAKIGKKQVLQLKNDFNTLFYQREVRWKECRVRDLELQNIRLMPDKKREV